MDAGESLPVSLGVSYRKVVCDDYPSCVYNTYHLWLSYLPINESQRNEFHNTFILFP